MGGSGGKSSVEMPVQRRTERFKFEQESARPGITKPVLTFWSKLSEKVGKPLQRRVVGKGRTSLLGKMHMHFLLLWDDCFDRRLSRVIFHKALFFCNSVVSVFT